MSKEKSGIELKNGNIIIFVVHEYTSI